MSHRLTRKTWVCSGSLRTCLRFGVRKEMFPELVLFSPLAVRGEWPDPVAIRETRVEISSRAAGCWGCSLNHLFSWSCFYWICSFMLKLLSDENHYWGLLEKHYFCKWPFFNHSFFPCSFPGLTWTHYLTATPSYKKQNQKSPGWDLKTLQRTT